MSHKIFRQLLYLNLESYVSWLHLEKKLFVWITIPIVDYLATDTCLKLIKTSKIALLRKQLTAFSSILDVWQSSEYVSGKNSK